MARLVGEGPTPETSPPPVSVAVAVRDEQDAIAPLLDRLLSQSRPPDEIVIADGGSVDATAEVVARYAPQGVRLVEVGPALPGHGRNRALEACRHEWVALTDAGCLPDPRWLEELTSKVNPFGSEPQAVFGVYEPVVSSEWDVAQAFTIVPPRSARAPSTASFLVQRSAWRAAGGFPEHLRAAEDLVFFARLARMGVTSVVSPAAVVSWSLAAGPAGFFRRLRLYSAHHVAAGLFRTWHLRVMVMNLAALALAGAALAKPWLWAVLGLAAAMRLASTVHRRRRNVPNVFPWRPDRLLRVGFLLLLADLAMWTGLLDFLRGRVAPR